MRKFVSALFVAVIALSAVFSSNEAQASHAAGAELIYTHITGRTYQVFFKFYRDCTGAGAPTSAQLCIYNTCTQTRQTETMNRWTGTLPPDGRSNGSPVSAGCSNYKTTCDGGSLPGYHEWWYVAIVQLPLKCNYYKMSASVNARNPQNNITPGTLYVETVFNTSNTHDNSSPYYSVKPIPYVCLNRPFTYNNGAIDPDGDSLSNTMINPMNHADCSTTPQNAPIVTLTPPINFNTNPLQTNNSFVLNNQTGQMSFSAGQLGASTITMKTDEYRVDTNNNASYLGYVMRDVQVQVLTCNPIPPSLDTIGGSITSGRFFNGEVIGCIGENLQFCFEVKSTDTAAILVAEDNLSAAIPAATITYTNLKTDSIRGCFSWTPGASDVGPHNFLVLVKDSTCKPPGILLSYAMPINLRILGETIASPDTSICAGESAFLGVSGGADYEWTIVSGTPNSLSNHFTANPTATPTQTTVYAVESRVNTFCPSFNKDTVEITVIKGPDIVKQLDTLTCPNLSVMLDAGIVKNPGWNYSILWTPATGLNDDTIETPISTVSVPTTYVVTIGSDSNRCLTRDTVLVDVLEGFSVENGDTAICLGQTVEIRATGDSRYDYNWTSNDNTATFNTAADLETIITPAKTGEYKYTVVAKHNNCPNNDSTYEFDIDVQPIPEATISDDESMCYGDTMQLRSVVIPNTYGQYSYDWSPGSALDFPDRPDPIFSAIIEGKQTITFVVTTPAGCGDTEEVNLEVFAASFIYPSNDTAICPGDSVTLATTVDDGVEFYWLPDLDISSISSLQPQVWPVTDQAYSIIGVDTLGCLDTATVKIEVKPRALIDMPDSITIFPGESYRMDPGGNCLYYTWFPPLGLSSADVSNPAVSPTVNTRYIVHGRTESGCSVTDSLDVIVKDGNYMDLPNAFTPGRRANGTLKVIVRGAVELKDYSIYNRWGQKVFETGDINEGWDGKFNGENQPVGVYIYSIEAITSAGQTITKQGNVTLIR